MPPAAPQGAETLNELDEADALERQMQELAASEPSSGSPVDENGFEAVKPARRAGISAKAEMMNTQRIRMLLQVGRTPRRDASQARAAVRGAIQTFDAFAGVSFPN